MEYRNKIRLDAVSVPERVASISVQFLDNFNVAAELVNICSHGIRIRIPGIGKLLQTPQKNNIMKVIFKSYAVVFTGMCIYSEIKVDDSAIVGIYFVLPSEQNILHNLLHKIVLPDDIYAENCPKLFVRHEWEELIDRMCHSDNPVIREKGLYELRLQQRQYPA